jgi:hypothetical protein
MPDPGRRYACSPQRLALTTRERSLPPIDSNSRPNSRRTAAIIAVQGNIGVGRGLTRYRAFAFQPWNVASSEPAPGVLPTGCAVGMRGGGQ